MMKSNVYKNKNIFFKDLNFAKKLLKKSKTPIFGYYVNEFKRGESEINWVKLNNNEFLNFISENNIKKDKKDNCIFKVEMKKFGFYESIKNKIDLSKRKLVLVLDRIQDTRNFGAICRTAKWAGVDTIFISHKGNAPISEGCLKSSSGYILQTEIISGKLKSITEDLKANGFFVVGTTVNSNITPDELLDYGCKDKIALLIGNERWGLSKYLSDLADKNVTIPMNDRVESLNVSVATGIILNEIVKKKEID